MAEWIASIAFNDPLMGTFAAWTRAAVFGLLWTHPGLDRRTRALSTVMTDTATATRPALCIHRRMARRQGWIADELGEAPLHAAGYIGPPWCGQRCWMSGRTWRK